MQKNLNVKCWGKIGSELKIGSAVKHRPVVTVMGIMSVGKGYLMFTESLDVFERLGLPPLQPTCPASVHLLLICPDEGALTCPASDPSIRESIISNSV